MAPIMKLSNNIRASKNGAGAAFTKLHFLCNLRMTQLARVLHYTRLQRLPSEKHSNLLDLSVSYKENEIFEYSTMTSECPRSHPGHNVIKKLQLLFTNIPNKLECMTLKSLSTLV
jgi:hypothetical protein